MIGTWRGWCWRPFNRVELFVWQLGHQQLRWLGLALDRLFIGIVWAEGDDE